MEVVIESETVRAEGSIERLFAGVAKGRMADVVRQGQGLCQFHIQA